MSEHSDIGSERHAATGPTTSRRLASLNLDYLRLLAIEGANTAQSAGLSAEWFVELADAPANRLQDLAACSFSLFNASLHNAGFWGRCAAAGEGDTAKRYATPLLSGSALRSAFLECVLFHAWHLVQVDRGSARSSLGLSDEVADILLGFELWQVRRAAIDYPHILAPRWAANVYFWPDLTQYLRTGERQYLDYARLLGTQLLAQDLEPSSIQHLTSVRRHLGKPLGRR